MVGRKYIIELFSLLEEMQKKRQENFLEECFKGYFQFISEVAL